MRAEAAERERDALRAEVERLTRERDDARESIDCGVTDAERAASPVGGVCRKGNREAAASPIREGQDCARRRL